MAHFMLMPVRAKCIMDSAPGGSMERKGKKSGEQFEGDVQKNPQQGGNRNIDEDLTRRGRESTTGGQQGTRQEETTRRTEEGTTRENTGTGTGRGSEEETRQAGSRKVGDSSRSGSSSKR
jgi:hypothetical protein